MCFWLVRLAWADTAAIVQTNFQKKRKENFTTEQTPQSVHNCHSTDMLVTSRWKQVSQVGTPIRVSRHHRGVGFVGSKDVQVHGVHGPVWKLLHGRQSRLGSQVQGDQGGHELCFVDFILQFSDAQPSWAYSGTTKLMSTKYSLWPPRSPCSNFHPNLLIEPKINNLS